MTPIRQIPEAEFWFRDIVFLRIAQGRIPGMVTGLILRETAIIYEVSWEGSCTPHYGYELSREYIPDYGHET